VTEPDFVRTWPRHCVAGTAGADYHPDLNTGSVTHHLFKGLGEPAYSIFEGRSKAGVTMSEMLTRHQVDDVDIVGIATDHCVRASALDALADGRRTRVFSDWVAGVCAESSRSALSELVAAGAQVELSTRATRWVPGRVDR